MDFYSKLSQFCVLIIYKIKVLIMDFYSKLSIINYQLQKYMAYWHNGNAKENR